MKKRKSQTPPRRKGSEPDANRDGLKLVQHPFSSLDPAAVKAALLSIAARKVGEFPDQLATIAEIFRAKYPPQILATLSSCGLMAGVSAEGVASKSMISKLEQHHTELVQALALPTRHGAAGGSRAMKAGTR